MHATSQQPERFRNQAAIALGAALVLGAVWLNSAAATQAANVAQDPPIQGETSDAREISQQATQLVQQLSSGKFQEREQATRELSAMGMPAEAALRAGLSSADAEVRARCRAILNDVLARDFLARQERFKADLDGTDSHGLPGFEEYQQLVGNKPVSRKLFADMLDQMPGVMASLAEEPEQLAKIVDERLENMYNFSGNIMDQPAAVASLFYASSLEGVRCQPDTLELLSYLITNPKFSSLAREGDTSEVCRAFLNRWLQNNAGLAPASSCMQMTLQYNLPAGLPLAVNVAEDKTANPEDRMFAILAIAKLGDVSHRPMLLELFRDRDVCRDYNVPGAHWTAEIRDIALAAVLHLSGDDPKEFGFSNLEKNELTVYSSATLSFSSERDRQAAFAKFYARFGTSAGDGN